MNLTIPDAVLWSAVGGAVVWLASLLVNRLLIGSISSLQTTAKDHSSRLLLGAESMSNLRDANKENKEELKSLRIEFRELQNQFVEHLEGSKHD